MGLCLNYTTTEAVTLDVQDAIRADLAQPGSDHAWMLCEPPHFYTIEGDGKLRGGSRLLLHPSDRAWDEADRDHQERNELQGLLHWLCNWSEAYDLIWDLSVEGRAFGQVVRGICLVAPRSAASTE